MNHIDLFNQIQSEWSSLFTFKSHSDTLEIITPVPTSNGKLVSVFVRHGADPTDCNLIDISDNKWLAEGAYNDLVVRASESLKKEYSVLQWGGEYYKYTDDPKLVPSMVFDMAHFIASAIQERDSWTYCTVRNPEKTGEFVTAMNGVTYSEKAIYSKEEDSWYVARGMLVVTPNVYAWRENAQIPVPPQVSGC